VFTAGEELKLVDYIMNYSKMLYGLGLQKSGGLAIPESCHAEKMAGKDWLEGFRKGNGAVSL